MSDDIYSDIDKLLGNVFPPTLEEIFDQRLKQMGMSRTSSQQALGVGYRPLKRILSGKEKTVDFTLLFRIAAFLDMEREHVVKLYMESLEQNIGSPTIPSQKISFIKENFDLPALRKAGVIESVRDFDVIEKRIVNRLGLNSIFEYRRPAIDVAFSSGVRKPENHLTRAFWLKSALASLQQIENPNQYNREQLIKMFPRIKLFSLNEEEGLKEVIKALFKVGVTVIFQPSLPTLQLRGATLVHCNKPCIILTNYMDFYPTLWFALIHELYHVLFDLDEIRESRYHLTDDTNDQSSVKTHEDLADEFAREYLLPKKKMDHLAEGIDNQFQVHRFAHENHVHPSIVYALYAYISLGEQREKAWKAVRKSFRKDMFYKVIGEIGINWRDEGDVESSISKKLATLYNH